MLFTLYYKKRMRSFFAPNVQVTLDLMLAACEPDESGNTESDKCGMRTECIRLIQEEL